MRTALRQEGFTLTELLFSTAITLIVLATAMQTFQNALTLNQTATLISDSNQNLRAGTNTMVRELMQAGRGIPTGGVSIPSGAGSAPINRPAPPGQAFVFDNVLSTSLPAIITGNRLGPTITNSTTDVITFLTVDPTSYVTYQPNGVPDDLILNANPLGPAGSFPAGLLNPAPTLSNNGQVITVSPQFATWVTDPTTGIKVGDLLLFQNVGGGNTLQTVTAVSPTTVTCAPGGVADWFNFNQPNAAAGNILALRDNTVNPPVFGQVSVSRVVMATYYVDAITAPATPRLVRQQNNSVPQALAGVVEDLDFTFDLVDGTYNPVQIPALPWTKTDVNPNITYTGNQIRKVNVHMAVRSEQFSNLERDYLRHHLTTTVSIRNLAFVDRYQ